MRGNCVDRVSPSACCAVLIAACAGSPQARAQAWVPGKGQGSVGMTYQQKQSTRLTNADGSSAKFGKVIDRTLSLDLDYGMSERWAVTVGVPFSRNRYTGDDPHDPRGFPFPNDQRFLDDGQDHAGWSDWSVGLRYQWRKRPFLVTPFIAYLQPSHDYTFFSHAALGTRQRAVQLGVHVGNWFPLPLQDMYWQAGYAYTIEQSTRNIDRVAYAFLPDDRRVNHGALSLEFGGNITPRLGAHLRVNHTNSYGHGVHAIEDFANPDGSPNFNNIFYHDQLLLLRTTKASVGLEYQLTDRYQLSFDWGRTLRAADAHFWKYETSIGISRRF